MTAPSSGPVFIHSLFRSGSTYLFNAFRRSPAGYWCYQEPEHEFLSHLDGDVDDLLQMADDTASTLRHPVLDKPYFFEFHQVRESLQGLFRKSFSYDDFFMPTPPGLDQDQQRYFSALITHAQGRSVLQFCRSAGRMAALKQAFGGVHVHLWRDPRNQWWSFKIADYFDASVQLIYNARQLPPVLAEAKQVSGITTFHDDDLFQEQEHARRHPLDSVANYFAFYALWLYALIEGERHAEVSIGIDRLSVDTAYRADTLQRLAECGIDAIDFSDCSTPRAVFTDKDDAFFKPIERRVLALFLAHGYEPTFVDACLALDNGLPAEAAPSALVRDAARAREVALRSFDLSARAEAQAAESETRAQRDAAHARQAEAQAQRDAAHARQAEEQAQRDQAHARQAEELAQRAEAHARQAEEHVRNTEAHSQRLQTAWDATKATLEERERTLAELERMNMQHIQELQTIYASKAWRITLPLRWANQQRVRLKTQGLAYFKKPTAKSK